MMVFIEGLLGPNEQLKALYEQHLSFYDEALPHVFFGEVTRYIMRIAQSGGEYDNELDRIIRYFNESYSTQDDSVQNLLSVSFLENLDRDNDSYFAIKSKLSGGLARQLATIEALT